MSAVDFSQFRHFRSAAGLHLRTTIGKSTTGCYPGLATNVAVQNSSCPPRRTDPGYCVEQSLSIGMRWLGK